MEDISDTTLWISPHVPDNAVLAVIGEITLRHSHLDHMLRMVIKSVTGVEVKIAISSLRRTGSAALRGRIEKIARQRFGDGETLIRLQDLLNRCERLTERRNTLTHNIWAQHLDGSDRETVLNDDLEWVAVPSRSDLRKLCDSIAAIQVEINDARLNGWLHAAIEQSMSR